MNVLKDEARPTGASDRLALPISSDFPEHKRVAAHLVDEGSFDLVALGSLMDGGRLQQQGGPLDLQSLTVEELGTSWRHISSSKR